MAQGLPAEEGDPEPFDLRESLLLAALPGRLVGLRKKRSLILTALPGILFTTLELSLTVEEHEEADLPVVGREHCARGCKLGTA